MSNMPTGPPQAIFLVILIEPEFYLIKGHPSLRISTDGSWQNYAGEGES